MAFLCPSRLGKAKQKRGYHQYPVGRLTGSNSIDTLLNIDMGKKQGLGPETRMIILHNFTSYTEEELTVKQGQKVNILYREHDWAYVITGDKKEGFVPFTYLARIGIHPSPPRAPITRPTGVKKDSGKASPRVAMVSKVTSDGGLSDSMATDEGSDQSPDSSPRVDSNHVKSIATHVSRRQSETSPTQAGKVELVIQPDNLYIQSNNKNDIAYQINKLNNINQNSHGPPRRPSPSLSQQFIPEVSSFRKRAQGDYLVLYGFEGIDENDLPVEAAERVTLLNTDDDNWSWVRNHRNEEGFVPRKFLFPVNRIQAKDARHLQRCSMFVENSPAMGSRRPLSYHEFGQPVGLQTTFTKDGVYTQHYPSERIRRNSSYRDSTLSPVPRTKASEDPHQHLTSSSTQRVPSDRLKTVDYTGSYRSQDVRDDGGVSLTEATVRDSHRDTDKNRHRDYVHTNCDHEISSEEVVQCQQTSPKEHRTSFNDHQHSSNDHKTSFNGHHRTSFNDHKTSFNNHQTSTKSEHTPPNESPPSPVEQWGHHTDHCSPRIENNSSQNDDDTRLSPSEEHSTHNGRRYSTEHFENASVPQAEKHMPEMHHHAGKSVHNIYQNFGDCPSPGARLTEDGQSSVPQQEHSPHILNNNTKDCYYNTEQAMQHGATEFVAIFDYEAEAETALSMNRGDNLRVELEDQDDDEWFWAYSTKHKQYGYIPRSYVKVQQITII